MAHLTQESPLIETLAVLSVEPIMLSHYVRSTKSPTDVSYAAAGSLQRGFPEDEPAEPAPPGGFDGTYVEAELGRADGDSSGG